MLVRDVKLEGGRQRHPSGGVSAKEMVIGLEGVELGADGKVRKPTAERTLARRERTYDHLELWSSVAFPSFVSF